MKYRVPRRVEREGTTAHARNSAGLYRQSYSQTPIDVESWVRSQETRGDGSLMEIDPLPSRGQSMTSRSHTEHHDISIVRTRHASKSRKPSSHIAELPGKRLTSYGGHRDEDVDVTEIPAPRNMRKRDRGTVYIDGDDEDDEDVQVIEPPPALKKVKRSNPPHNFAPTMRLPPPPPPRIGSLTAVVIRPKAQEIRPEPLKPRPSSVPQPHPQQLDLGFPTEEQSLQLKSPNKGRPRKQAAKQEATHPRPKQPAAKTLQVAQRSPPGDYFFKNVSEEIRNEIYRHLLVSNKPICVMGLWTESSRGSARRGRRGRHQQADEDADTNVIDTRILRVSRQAFIEGSRILYSENTFLYKLRDPQAVPADILTNGNTPFTTRGSRHRRLEVQAIGNINFTKYAHLFRHLSIELESNRTEEKYEHLMVCVLDALVTPAEYGQLSRRTEHPAWFPKTKIRLHSLTITISPAWEPVSRRRLNNDDLVVDGHSLSVARFFDEEHRVMRALKTINTNFLRINVHVPMSPTRVDDTGDDTEDDDEDVEGLQQPVASTRHLETTIDLRFHPRHLASKRRDDLSKTIWRNDKLIFEKRRQAGVVAEKSFTALRERIQAACLDPDDAILHGWWEDHVAAEVRREAFRARQLAKFDGVEEPQGLGFDEDDEDDSFRRSLIIHMQRDLAGALRAYREGA